MLDKNKQCKNCGFDTMAIVTVETSNWEYCPMCGSRFVSVKDDIEGNVDEEDVKMRDIPLSEDDSEDDENDSVKDSDEEDQSRKIELNSDGSDEVNQKDTEQTEKSQTGDETVSDDSDSIGEDEDLDELMDDSDFVEDELNRLRKFVDDEDEDE